ncbi:MAG: DCC1-like thiol-disulfide oxidoreductase family protein [Siphonobacter sp.]
MTLILFDGICNFCNATINYVMDHDGGRHQFASLQSEIGQRILKQFDRNLTDFDSILLLENNQLYEKSEAILRIAHHVKGWKWLYFFRFIPRFLRDHFYTFIARNRYNWFGKTQTCRIPTPAEKARFVA